MSGEPKGPSGTAPKPPSGSPEPNPPKKDTVLYETHEKLLSEKKKLDARHKETADKLAALEKEKKDLADEELKKQGKFQEALAAKEKELADTNQRLQARDQQMVDGQKINSFLKAVDSDVKENYWGLIDLEKIKLDAQGNIDETSVKTYASEFKETYSEIIGGQAPPRMPNGPSSPPANTKLTHEEWKNLPTSEKSERQKDVDPATFPQDI